MMIITIITIIPIHRLVAALEAQVKPDGVSVSSEVLGSPKYLDITSTIKDHQAELTHLKDLTSNLERTMANLKVLTSLQPDVLFSVLLRNRLTDPSVQLLSVCHSVACLLVKLFFAFASAPSLYHSFILSFFHSFILSCICSLIQIKSALFDNTCAKIRRKM